MKELLVERKNIIAILIGVMALAMIVVAGIYVYYPEVAPIESPEVETITVSEEPVKTDFGTSVPTDFPTNIPIEEGVKAEQSYSLNYAGQKQLTIVFASAKTVKENYALYTDFLAKEGWTVSNKYESPKLSSLYGIKGSDDINVTISEKSTDASAKSQVSISVLKK